MYFFLRKKRFTIFLLRLLPQKNLRLESYFTIEKKIYCLKLLSARYLVPSILAELSSCFLLANGLAVFKFGDSGRARLGQCVQSKSMLRGGEYLEYPTLADGLAYFYCQIRNLRNCPFVFRGHHTRFEFIAQEERFIAGYWHSILQVLQSPS